MHRGYNIEHNHNREVQFMGMTDRQFDEYRKNLLREMKRLRKKLDTDTEEMKKEFDEMLHDMEESLKRP